MFSVTKHFLQHVHANQEYLRLKHLHAPVERKQTRTCLTVSKTILANTTLLQPRPWQNAQLANSSRNTSTWRARSTSPWSAAWKQHATPVQLQSIASYN